MNVDAIVKKIIAEEAEQERRRIFEFAKNESTKIVKETQVEVAEAVNHNKPIFEQKGSVARARLIHQAEFEAQTKNASEKQNIYKTFLKDVMSQLGTVASQPNYRELLKSLIQEALGMIDRSPKVHVRKEDVSLTEQILKEMGRGDLGVVGDLKGWGGVRLESLDGKISLDNTLESRLNKALEVFKEQIGKDLFA